MTLVIGTGDRTTPYEGGPLTRRGLSGRLLKRRAAKHGELPGEDIVVGAEAADDQLGRRERHHRRPGDPGARHAAGRPAGHPEDAGRSRAPGRSRSTASTAAATAGPAVPSASRPGSSARSAGTWTRPRCCSTWPSARPPAPPAGPCSTSASSPRQDVVLGRPAVAELEPASAPGGDLGDGPLDVRPVRHVVLAKPGARGPVGAGGAQQVLVLVQAELTAVLRGGAPCPQRAVAAQRRRRSRCGPGVIGRASPGRAGDGAGLLVDGEVVDGEPAVHRRAAAASGLITACHGRHRRSRRAGPRSRRRSRRTRPGRRPRPGHRAGRSVPPPRGIRCARFGGQESSRRSPRRRSRSRRPWSSSRR